MRKRHLETGSRVIPAGGVLTLALAMGGGVLWLLPLDFESKDYIYSYAPLAESLLQGRGFVYPEGGFDADYPPGYPLILAGLFKLASLTALPREWVLTGFHLAVFAFCAVALLAISGMMWEGRWAVLPPVLFCTYPLSLWLLKQPMSEIPFMLFLYTSVYFLLKGKNHKNKSLHSLISGILIGAAIIIRPIGLATNIIFSLYIIIHYKSINILKRCLTILWLHVGSLFVLFPWIAFCYHKTGHVILVSTNLAPSIIDGWSFAVDPAADHRLPFDVSEDVREWMTGFLQQCGGRRSGSEVLSCLFSRLQEQPLPGLKVAWWKMGRAWYGTNSGRWETVVGLFQILYLPVIVGSVAVGLRRKGGVRDAALLIILLLSYFWGVTVMVLSIVRYLVPAIGLSFIMAPALFQRLAWRDVQKATLP